MSQSNEEDPSVQGSLDMFQEAALGDGENGNDNVESEFKLNIN